MPLSSEQRAKLLTATREAAGAFLEDIQYIRDIANQTTTLSGEIRRLSVLLRRLLIDRDLALIGAPRIGRVLIRAPDNNPIFRHARSNPPVFFSSGRGRVFGFRGIIYATFSSFNNTPLDRLQEVVMPKDFDYKARIDLPIDNFIAQRVICFRGNWVSRKEIIKYVANIASGAHSGSPKTKDEILIAQIRSQIALRLTDNGIQVALMEHGPESEETTFRYQPNSLDPVLIELLGTISFLAESPRLNDLEAAIRSELK
jgi:hypothetical protein